MTSRGGPQGRPSHRRAWEFIGEGRAGTIRSGGGGSGHGVSVGSSSPQGDKPAAAEIEAFHRPGGMRKSVQADRSIPLEHLAWLRLPAPRRNPRNNP